MIIVRISIVRQGKPVLCQRQIVIIGKKRSHIKVVIIKLIVTYFCAFFFQIAIGFIVISARNHDFSNNVEVIKVGFILNLFGETYGFLCIVFKKNSYSCAKRQGLRGTRKHPDSKIDSVKGLSQLTVQMIIFCNISQFVRVKVNWLASTAGSLIPLKVMFELLTLEGIIAQSDMLFLVLFSPGILESYSLVEDGCCRCAVRVGHEIACALELQILTRLH